LGKSNCRTETHHWGLVKKNKFIKNLGPEISWVSSFFLAVSSTMINYIGSIIAKHSALLTVNNRAFKYGDALFETLKVIGDKIIFAEDHYFRLMASMRMLRMKIPIEFTLDFFKKEILKTVEAQELESARVRLSVYRKDGGFYLPKHNTIEYIIEAHQLNTLVKTRYEVDLFKDYYVYSGLLSTLKTTNKIINVLASIFADENDLDNCLLINEKKQLVEALNANVFLVNGNQVITPPLSEGCLKGIVRKNIIDILHKDADYTIVEAEISPFELQKVDEVFLTNTILGVQPVTGYRKKMYTTEVAVGLQKKLAILEDLSS